MDVTITGSGTQANIEAQVDPSRGALRVSTQPLEFSIAGVQGGHYAANFTTGAISAIAAGGQIFSVRWNDPSKLMFLERVYVSATCTAFSSGTGADLEIVRASSFTAVGSGGTVVTPSTASQAVRPPIMAPTSFSASGELRIATTAALTAGTQTLDTAGFGAIQLGATGAGGSSGPFDLFSLVVPGLYPMSFANNQGFVVRAITAVPSSNTFRYSIGLQWLEALTF